MLGCHTQLFGTWKMSIKTNLDKIRQTIGKFEKAVKFELPTVRANHLIGLLKDRGYNDRDRLFRKLIEEAGEYAEAMEYERGATRKVAKYQGETTPKEKLTEEISDVVMVALALARTEGLMIEDVLSIINRKLGEREDEYQRSKDETE